MTVAYSVRDWKRVELARENVDQLTVAQMTPDAVQLEGCDSAGHQEGFALNGMSVQARSEASDQRQFLHAIEGIVVDDALPAPAFRKAVGVSATGRGNADGESRDAADEHVPIRVGDGAGGLRGFFAAVTSRGLWRGSQC